MNKVGVILAGGKSTRMKQDKALLNFEGVSLLQRQFEMLERLLGQGSVIVSGYRPEFPYVSDINPGLGPVEGLRSVCLHLLKEGRLDSLLVVPVDMPLMTDSGLSRLINFDSQKPCTKFKGQQLPLMINNPTAVLSALEDMLGKSDAVCIRKNSFKNLYNKIEVQEITAESGHFFANMNTPEEWNAALS